MVEIQFNSPQISCLQVFVLFCLPLLLSEYVCALNWVFQWRTMAVTLYVLGNVFIQPSYINYILIKCSIILSQNLFSLNIRKILFSFIIYFYC